MNVEELKSELLGSIGTKRFDEVLASLREDPTPIDACLVEYQGGMRTPPWMTPVDPGLRAELCAWLLSVAPPGSRAERLREDATKWTVHANGNLRALLALPITDLQLYAPVVDLGLLSQLKSLRSLRVFGPWKSLVTLDASDLRHDGITRLNCSRLVIDGFDPARFPSLEQLHLTSSELAQPLRLDSATLTSVNLHRTSGEVTVRALPAATRLNITAPLHDLPALPLLREADLTLPKERDVARVLSLPELRALTLDTSITSFPAPDGPVVLDSFTLRPSEAQALTLPEMTTRTLSIKAADKLRFLCLRAVKTDQKLTLEKLPQLTEFNPCGARSLLVKETGLGTLRWLADESFEQVEIWKWPHALDLADLELEDLSRLDLHLFAPDLRGFPRAPKLAHLSLVRSEIESLNGIPPLPALTHLDLSKTRKLIDAHALTDVPSLAHMQCTSNRLSAARIPAALHDVVRPISVVKKSTSTRSAKPKPKRRTGKAGKQAARLKKLLLSRDMDTISHAAELVGALGDEEVLGALLDGTVAGQEKTTAALRKGLHAMVKASPIPKAHDVLVRNSVFDSGMIVRTYREHAVRALLARAPATFLKSEREAIRSLLITGLLTGWKKAEVDLSTLAAFPKLAHVTVMGAGDIRGGDSLPKTLTSMILAWTRIGHAVSLEGGLTQLTTSHSDVTVASSSIESLTVFRGSVGSLREMPRLTTLKVRSGASRVLTLKLSDTAPRLQRIDAIGYVVDGSELARSAITSLIATQVAQPELLPTTLRHLLMVETTDALLDAVPPSVEKITLWSKPRRPLARREVVDRSAFDET